jgi:hypothetical protein
MQHSSAELRLPTTAVEVRLAVVAGVRPPAAATAELFVTGEAHRGRGALLDEVAAMLAAEAEFLPVRVDGAVELLAKHALRYVALARRGPAAADFAVEEPSEVITLYDRRHAVAVELFGGEVLRGTILDSSPADRPRVADLLNRGERFVRLWTPDAHVLINKAQIVRVTEVAAAE